MTYNCRKSIIISSFQIFWHSHALELYKNKITFFMLLQLTSYPAFVFLVWGPPGFFLNHFHADMYGHNYTHSCMHTHQHTHAQVHIRTYTGTHTPRRMHTHVLTRTTHVFKHVWIYFPSR